MSFRQPFHGLLPEDRRGSGENKTWTKGNNMTDLTNLTDHAAQQNYQWMFVALFILILIFVIVIWRWVIADREKLTSRLTEMTDRYITATEKMTEVVANNTIAMKEVREVMAVCRNVTKG
jgi:hypothetical protein